ncbi:MAG TPA: hypothetical protein VIM62_04095 [Acidobacteriaceae bacterium]
MSLRLTRIAACLCAGLTSCLLAVPAVGQAAMNNMPSAERAVVAAVELPDAPLPQQAPQSPQPAPTESQSSSSSSGAAQQAPQSADAQQPAKSKEQLADEQLKQEKKQRVLGFMPSFNTSYDNNAVSLTRKQKFKLAFAQATDPFQFLIAGIAGGISEAEGSDYGYGGGPAGYFKRVGADYADSFDGAMIGNALLPSLLHQDPRFFRRGYGSAKKRIFYALSTSFVCKHDNTGKWEPNYSNIGGNLAAGAISTLYVPDDERTAGNVFEGFALVTIEGAGGAVLQEFWPDISRRFFHKDPTHGHDAMLRAAHGER